MSGSLGNGYLSEIKKHLTAVSQARGGCNVLYYYNQDFLNSDDAEQFGEAIKDMDGAKELVFILRTPGGDGKATRKIVSLMREKFNDVTAIVPQRAISAGTVIALSCNRLILGKGGRISQTDLIIDEVRLAAKELLLARKGHTGKRTVNAETFVENLISKLDAEEKYDKSRRRQAEFLKKAGRSEEARKKLLHFFHDDPEHEHKDEFDYEALTAQGLDQHMPLECLEDSRKEDVRKLAEPVREATAAVEDFAKEEREAFEQHGHLFVP